MEELHDHDWGVWVAIRGPRLDEEHLLVDFHAVERALASAVEPFRGRTMNGTPPFDQMLPTAERVAEFIGARLEGVLPEGVWIHTVSVEEAPGCIARWIPTRSTVPA